MSNKILTLDELAELATSTFAAVFGSKPAVEIVALEDGWLSIDTDGDDGYYLFVEAGEAKPYLLSSYHNTPGFGLYHPPDTEEKDIGSYTSAHDCIIAAVQHRAEHLAREHWQARAENEIWVTA